MKTRSIAIGLLLLIVIAGCGLVSGTIFLSQKVNGTINSQVGTSLLLQGRGQNLDDAIGGVVVDFTDNSDWKDYTIEGVEDGCIRFDATNHLATPVTGEVWITLDTTVAANVDAIRANGFRIFHGMALAASETKTFTCANTLPLLENVEQLTNAIVGGRFKAWGLGEQDSYNVTFSNIYLGAHVTGSK